MSPNAKAPIVARLNDEFYTSNNLFSRVFKGIPNISNDQVEDLRKVRSGPLM